MKNKVLKTIGYIVGITWLFTACALDDEGEPCHRYFLAKEL